MFAVLLDERGQDLGRYASDVFLARRAQNIDRKVCRTAYGQSLRQIAEDSSEARGVHMGRPPMLTAHQKAEALKAIAEGTATQADLARRFNVSQSTISRLVARR